jgi:hypothetical protein
MKMADVFAVFGTLLAVGIALPGLLLAWQLLLPKLVDRAQQRLDHTPWQCFFSGTGFFFIYLIPILIFFNLPWGGFRAIGGIVTLILAAIASIGAAGLAKLMGHRISNLGFNASAVGATVRGAVAMELAAAFPLIGWFIFIPLTFIVALGAALFALVGWMPRPKATVVALPSHETVATSV